MQYPGGFRRVSAPTKRRFRLNELNSKSMFVVGFRALFGPSHIAPSVSGCRSRIMTWLWPEFRDAINHTEGSYATVDVACSGEGSRWRKGRSSHFSELINRKDCEEAGIARKISASAGRPLGQSFHLIRQTELDVVSDE